MFSLISREREGSAVCVTSCILCLSPYMRFNLAMLRLHIACASHQAMPAAQRPASSSRLPKSPSPSQAADRRGAQRASDSVRILSARVLCRYRHRAQGKRVRSSLSELNAPTTSSSAERHPIPPPRALQHEKRQKKKSPCSSGQTYCIHAAQSNPVGTHTPIAPVRISSRTAALLIPSYRGRNRVRFAAWFLPTECLLARWLFSCIA